MCVLFSTSDELVDWDPWQPAATSEGGDYGPHCDDPDFNVRMEMIIDRFCSYIPCDLLPHYTALYVYMCRWTLTINLVGTRKLLNRQN